MKKIVINKDDIELLYSFLGIGPFLKAKFVFLGNEFGLSSKSINDLLNIIKNKIRNNDITYINKAFILDYINDSSSIKSIFVQFCSRLLLALETKDERWFGELSKLGKISLNNYILNKLHKENSCIINLRPLPRPTERQWIYENINEKDYMKKFNYILKNYKGDNLSNERLINFNIFLNKVQNAVKICSGNKENKKYFFLQLNKILNENKYQFELIDDFYIDKINKIIISNYFDNRSGIKLNGLNKLYHKILELNE